MKASQTFGSFGPNYGIGMGEFCDDHNTYIHSEQHSEHISDSVEDSISDEDDLAPTGLSLACAASKLREKDIKREDHDEAATWNEVLEEADELVYMHKEPPSVSFISGGSSRRGRSGNKLRFSIRSHSNEGSWTCALNEKTETSYIGEKEVLSGQLVPPPRTSETMMAKLLENLKEETEDLPLDFAPPNKKAMVSVAELLEDLQDRNGSSFGTSIPLRQDTKAKKRRPKFSTSGRKTSAFLGKRVLDSEDPLEYITGETSSEEEDIGQNHLSLAKKDVEGHTMVDLFQEAFSTSNMEGSALPMKLNGTGYYGRLQQIMQIEKDRHLEFLRQSNSGQGYLNNSKEIAVQILSRSLEGKLTVCHCLFKEKSDFPMTGKDSTDCDMDDSCVKGTVIFSSKICDNVDLVAGNIIHIYPPWKEVPVKEDEKVILCMYFSNHAA